MSDLAATHCGSSCEGSCFGGNSCLWILILLFCCGNGNGFGCGGNDSCGCDSIIPLILILCCCGGCGGCGGNGCGC